MENLAIYLIFIFSLILKNSSADAVHVRLLAVFFHYILSGNCVNSVFRNPRGCFVFVQFSFVIKMTNSSEGRI